MTQLSKRTPDLAEVLYILTVIGRAGEKGVTLGEIVGYIENKVGNCDSNSLASGYSFIASSGDMFGP